MVRALYVNIKIRVFYIKLTMSQAFSPFDNAS